MSASWNNTQPWKAIITMGNLTNDFEDKLFLHATQNRNQLDSDFPFPTQYQGIYNERRRDCAWQLYDSVGVVRGDREASARQSGENFRLFGAPHVAIVTSPKDLGTYGALDCGIYISNFMLAAQSQDVSTATQAAIAKYSSFVRNYFGISPDRAVVCGISFGYADREHSANNFRTRRAAVNEVAEFRWG